MKQKLIPLASILIGFLAFFLTHHYIQRQFDNLDRIEAELYAGARKTPVVVASRDIPAGTVIVKDDLASISLYENAKPEGVIPVDDVMLLLNRKLLWPVKAKTPIVWSQIEGSEGRRGGLSPIIKHRMRAISISVSGAASVSGMVQANDRVDVLGTFSFPSKIVDDEMETVTLTVLQDVTVLAVGQTLGTRSVRREKRRSSSYSTVTVEVTPREAELLVFAQQTQGKLSLSLRNPTDIYSEQVMPEINFDYLVEKLPELNATRQRVILGKQGGAGRRTE